MTHDHASIAYNYRRYINMIYIAASQDALLTKLIILLLRSYIIYVEIPRKFAFANFTFSCIITTL